MGFENPLDSRPPSVGYPPWTICSTRKRRQDHRASQNQGVSITLPDGQNRNKCAFRRCCAIGFESLESASRKGSVTDALPLISADLPCDA